MSVTIERETPKATPIERVEVRTMNNGLTIEEDKVTSPAGLRFTVDPLIAADRGGFVAIADLPDLIDALTAWHKQLVEASR